MAGASQYKTKIHTEVEIVTINTESLQKVKRRTLSYDSDSSDNSDYISTSFVVETSEVLPLQYPDFNTYVCHNENDNFIKSEKEMQEGCVADCSTPENVDKLDEQKINVEIKVEENSEPESPAGEGTLPNLRDECESPNKSQSEVCKSSDVITERLV